jgi:hypothetical protein
MKSAPSTSGAGRSQFVTLSLQLPAGIAIAALLLGAAGPPAYALPLRAAESFLLACAAQDGRGDTCGERRIQGTGREFRFGTFTGGFPNVGAMGTATAETSGGQGGLRPMATVSGSALGGGVDLFDRVQNQGSARAILTYEVAIGELLPPPVFTPVVPIEARIRAETSAFASPTAGGSDAAARAVITLLRMIPPSRGSFDSSSSRPRTSLIPVVSFSRTAWTRPSTSWSHGTPCSSSHWTQAPRHSPTRTSCREPN